MSKSRLLYKDIDGASVTTDSKNDRITSIDVFKGVAIIGIVLSHVVALQQVEGEGAVTFSAGEFVYMMLPMFLVISGYFYNPRKSFRDYMKGRILPMVLAFIVANVALTALMFGYLSLLGYDMDASTLIPNISKMLLGRSAFEPIIDPWFEIIYDVYDVTHSLYYLEMLMLGSVLFYIIAGWALKNWKRTFGTIFLLNAILCIYIETVGIQLPFHAHLAPFATSLLLIGAFFGKHKVAEYIQNGQRDRKYWSILFVLLAGSILMVWLFPSRMSLIYSIFGYHGGYSVFTFYIMAILCGGVLMYVFTFVSKIKVIGNGLSYLGRHSLSIFILHMFFAKLLTAPFFTLNTRVWIPVKPIPIALTIAVVSILLCLATDQVFTRCRGSLRQSKDDSTLNR